MSNVWETIYLVYMLRLKHDEMLVTEEVRHVILRWLFFFFFQAEDGIRDYKVTGVQTCALPICVLGRVSRKEREEVGGGMAAGAHHRPLVACEREPFWRRQRLLDARRQAAQRSEERRVGKECRSRWSPYH